jgi:hypothetical protein
MSYPSKLLAASLFVLIASPACAQPTMVGTWFGQGQPDSKESMYIDRMRADGGWRGEYRTCIKGKSSDQVQEGSWALKGDTLILKVEFVDGRRAPRVDNYKMIARTATTQKYISQSFNFPYTPKKMADDFQMPSCELTS